MTIYNICIQKTWILLLLGIERMSLFVHIFHITVYFWSLFELIFLTLAILILSSLTIISRILFTGLLHRPSMMNVWLSSKCLLISIYTITSIWYRLIRRERFIITLSIWIAISVITILLLCLIWISIVVLIQHLVDSLILWLIVVRWT